MQDKFDAKLRATFEVADEYRNVVERLKKQAREDPEGLAVRIAGSVPYQMEQWREQAAKLFGVDLAERDSLKEFKPHTIAEAQVFCYLADRYEVFRRCLWKIEHYIGVKRLVGRPFAEMVCEAGLEATQHLPVLIASDFQVFRRRLAEQGVPERLSKLLKDQEAQWLTGLLATKISLSKNRRLARAIDDIRPRSPEKSAKREQFETLLRELYVEAPESSAWSEHYPSPEGLLATRTAVVKKIEAGSGEAPCDAGEIELAQFAEREALLKRARDAGLTPREYELFALVVRDPERFLRNDKLNHSEAARALSVATGTTKSLWSRTKKKIFAA